MQVASWWYFLCTVALLNILAWLVSVAVLRRQRPNMPQDSYAACRTQVILAAGYVFGCAFRSALPVFDVPRLCLFDIWLSSVIVGRSVATIAELCFAAQWAFLLGAAARTTQSSFLWTASRLLVPFILIAEICSWYAVLTTSNLGHVIEEAIWGASAVMIVISLAAFRPRCPAKWRSTISGAQIVGTIYAAYMFLIDVPMYWQRWLADESRGHGYLTISQGLFDTLERRVVSHRWEDWQGEVTWMSLYFSIAVWISIALIFAARGALFARRRSS